MKICPVCDSKMSVNETHCPKCGEDYLASVVGDIISSSGRDSELELKLENLEEGLSGIESLPKPTLGDTARRLMPVLSAVGALFFFLSGMLTRVHIFYILAIILFIIAVIGFIVKFSGRKPLCKGEVILHAAARIFNEDSAVIREQYGNQGGVAERLDAMQMRLDEAFARLEAAHERNMRKVLIITAVVIVICSAGVGALAVKKNAIRMAEAEYAMQPEWVKLRDNYAGLYQKRLAQIRFRHA
jgi:NADH:ubiquinone oxidoreductase subunit K